MKTTSRAIFAAFFLSLGTTASLRAHEVDLSAIVPKADAENLLGGDVGAPTVHHDESTNGVQSKLDYRSASTRKTLLLAVIQTKAGSHARAAARDFDRGREPPATGQRHRQQGRFFRQRAEENSKAGRLTMLYVAKGATFVSVGLGGFSDAKAALATEEEIAQKILAQL